MRSERLQRPLRPNPISPTRPRGIPFGRRSETSAARTASSSSSPHASRESVAGVRVRRAGTLPSGNRCGGWISFTSSASRSVRRSDPSSPSSSIVCGGASRSSCRPHIAMRAPRRSARGITCRSSPGSSCVDVADFAKRSFRCTCSCSSSRERQPGGTMRPNTFDSRSARDGSA